MTMSEGKEKIEIRSQLAKKKKHFSFQGFIS